MKEFSKQWLDNWRRDCRLLRRWQRPCQQDRGAALLEFALTLPMLLIITIFLVEMALYWEGRILGNHASFALARIAKVHYQPGLAENKQQTLFPKKCLLHSHLVTENGMQARLPTEKLVAAFFMFPVTRQKINDNEKIVSVSSYSSSPISSFINRLSDIISEVEFGLFGTLADEIAENASNHLANEIFSEERIGRLLSSFGDSWTSMFFHDLVSAAVRQSLQNAVQPLLNDLSKNTFNYAIDQCRSFSQHQLPTFKSFLANFNDDTDEASNNSDFLANGFLLNCYSRYDLACQRVHPDAASPNSLKVWAERLIPEEDDDYDKSTSFGERFKAWFLSLNPFKSSSDAEKQYKDWNKKAKKFKNITAACLCFPRHAFDAEAPAAIVAVEFTYPVKSHWFSLTAAMSEDNTFKKAGQVTFTCNHASLAELPKQNINEYFFEYKTHGQKGDAGRNLLGFFSKMMNIVEEINKRLEPVINFPLFDEWVYAQNSRRDRQSLIISELSNIEELFESTSDANLHATKNYQPDANEATRAMTDLEGAITKIGNKKTISSKASGLIETYTKKRDLCYTLNEDGIKEKTDEWNIWDGKIDTLVSFSERARKHLNDMRNAINGTSPSLSYEGLVASEFSVWNNLVEYYNVTLKTDIESHKFSASDQSSQPGNNNNSQHGEIPELMMPEPDKQQAARDEILEKLQENLDKSRQWINSKVFDAIADLTDYDLFNNSDEFDNLGGPQGLRTLDNASDEAYRRLNIYYGTSAELPMSFRN